VILVHGLGVSPRYFRPLAAELTDLDVAAPDLRGGNGLDGMVRGLEAAVGAPGALLVGNSFGCQLIAELAVRRPELVGAAVFVGPTVDRRHRTWLQQAGRLALDALREPPLLVALVLRDYVQTGPLRTVRMARDALGDPVERKLERFDAPLLVVRGEHDPLCPQEWAEELVRRAPHGRLKVVRGAAHAAHYSHADAVATLVRTLADTAT
jgi:pimeloyl-ACP methyl ester carboxylesterase